MAKPDDEDVVRGRRWNCYGSDKGRGQLEILPVPTPKNLALGGEQ